MDKQEISDFVLSELQDFSLYKEEHEIYVSEHENGTSIGYHTGKLTKDNIPTHFDIEARGKLGIINSLWIDHDKKGKGYGTQLYGIIETILRKCGCKKIILTPSGEGKYFWEILGFKNMERGGTFAEKII